MSRVVPSALPMFTRMRDSSVQPKSGALDRVDPEALQHAAEAELRAEHLLHHLVLREEEEREHQDDEQHRDHGVADDAAERVVLDDLLDDHRDQHDAEHGADRLRCRHPAGDEAPLIHRHLVGDRGGDRGRDHAEADDGERPEDGDADDVGLQAEHDERDREDDGAGEGSTDGASRAWTSCGRRGTR